MYSLCKAESIPHRNTKKWIVAQNDNEWEACLKLHEHAQRIGVPTKPIPLEEGKRREPDVQAKKGILESESTGIVDSHSLMQYLLGEFKDDGGDVALHSSVTSIFSDPVQGYQITINDKASSTPISITAETVVNSAGLSAVAISNMLLPSDRQMTPYYCKGSYFAYSRSHPKPSTLVYPAPSPGHGGLGTHLTVDLSGQVRFGPDVEWVDDPNDLDPENAQLDKAIEEIVRYLPGVDREALRPDYAGMRPKLGKTAAAAQGDGFEDFVIRKEEGFEGFINLLGIESPGLTSSLAIAEKVENLLYK